MEREHSRPVERQTASAPHIHWCSGVSLFSGTAIPGDYVKAMAQAGRMKSVLYAVAEKGTRMEFRPPTSGDLAALEAAEKELKKLRPS